MSASPRALTATGGAEVAPGRADDGPLASAVPASAAAPALPQEVAVAVDVDDPGGADDLGAVVREHLPSLLRYAAALTGDRDLAADVVQEVLVRAHSRWRRIALLERPDLYLRRMVTNGHLSW